MAKANVDWPRVARRQERRLKARAAFVRANLNTRIGEKRVRDLPAAERLAWADTRQDRWLH